MIVRIKAIELYDLLNKQIEKLEIRNEKYPGLELREVRQLNVYKQIREDIKSSTIMDF